MGRRGPIKKPIEAKKAEGTYRADRDAAAAVGEQPAAGAPAMPKGLGADGKRRWSEIVPELLRIGTLTVVDGGSLEAYCRAWARWVKLEKMAFTTPTGDSAVESRKLHKEVIQPLELALGLHYAARSRVKMPAPPDKADPAETDLFGTQPPELTAIAGGKP